MSQQGSVTVIDKEGVRGTIEAPSHPPYDSYPRVLVHLDYGRRVVVPGDLLVAQKDGSYRVLVSFKELETEVAGSTLREDETVVVPLLAEDLEVEKRTVEIGKVRVAKVVHEREEVVDEPVVREEVEVQRIPINRIVDGAVQIRHEGNTLIVPLVEEVLWVEKRLVLKEELHITKKRVEARERRRVTLRTEDAVVERVASQADESGTPSTP